MQTVIVSGKGQALIPDEICQCVGITPGCQLDFTLEGKIIRVELKSVIQPTHLKDGYGCWFVVSRVRSCY